MVISDSLHMTTLLTWSFTGADVGRTMEFCETAIFTKRGGCVCSLAALMLYPLISKFFSLARAAASAGISRVLHNHSTTGIGRERGCHALILITLPGGTILIKGV